MTIVIFLWHIRKCLNGTHNFVIQEFILWGVVIYHSFTVSKRVWSLNLFAFFGNQWKVAIYTGCQKWIYCPTSNAFLAIFKGSSRMMPHFKSVFKVGYIMRNRNYIFSFRANVTAAWKKVSIIVVFLLIISSSCHSIFFKDLILQAFKLIWEGGILFIESANWADSI